MLRKLLGLNRSGLGHSRYSRSGQAPLIIILMGASFTLASYVLISTYTSVESNLDIRFQDERLQLEQTLMGSIDCQATMLQFDIDTPADLDSKCTQVLADQGAGPFVPMINSDGDNILNDYNTAGGYGDAGNWSFRASCYRSGATACVLVHAARPFKGGTPGNPDFKQRALGSQAETWKKLPNSPWLPQCCFGPPVCAPNTISLSPNPIARGNTATFILNPPAGTTSATITTTDGLLSNVDIPLSPGTLPFTPTANGINVTANVVLNGPAGETTCSTTYSVVDPPACDLDVISPSSPHVVTFGQPGTLRLTWTNNLDVSATPTSAELVSIQFPPAPETQMATSGTFAVPTQVAPSSTRVVTPPMGKTNQLANGFRAVYRARISNAAGSSMCDSEPFQICPLGSPVNLYLYQNPPGDSCTTCDYADGFTPPPGYSTMTHGFSISTVASFPPNLATISQNNSATLVDYWTGRTNLGGAGYGSPDPLFYAYASNTEAPGLIPVAQWTRLTGDQRQDSFLFPNDGSQAALESAFTTAGYNKTSANEFFACSYPANYTPTGSPGAPGVPGPSSPGVPGPGPSSVGPSSPGPSSPGPSGPSAAGPSGPSSGGGCRGSEPLSGQDTIVACGNSRQCKGVSTMREFYDFLCDGYPCMYLKNSIDAANVKWTCGCSSPMAPQVLDGKGFTIQNFDGKQQIQNPVSPGDMAWRASLFQRDHFAGGSTICNLRMDNMNVDTTFSWGSMISGFMDWASDGNTTFDNVHLSNSNLSSSGSVAGILGASGQNSGSGQTIRIKDSTVDANLSAPVVAGVVAFGASGTLIIDNVNVTGTLTALAGPKPGWESHGSGGILASNTWNTGSTALSILNSRFAGNLIINPGTFTTSSTHTSVYGGLVGGATTTAAGTLTITNSRFDGGIAGGTVRAVGGIAGQAGCRTTMTNVVSAGTIDSPDADYVGGVFGEQVSGTAMTYTGTSSTTSVVGKTCIGSAFGRARTTDAHSGMTISGSASGIGSVNTVNSNTGCAPSAALTCSSN